MREGGRFVPEARQTWGFAERVKVELPAEGSEPLVFRAKHGFEARVREIGADGEGRIVDRAVAYPRDGGVSYWTTVSGGVEEWLHLAPDHVSPDQPAASWHVTGASVRQRGSAVELAGADGVARVQITAPAAFGKGGRRVGVRLAAHDATVDLFVDAKGEAVLVDPLWIPAGPLTGPRFDHRDATLGNGHVLIAGGSDGLTSSVPNAMVYDPNADAWSDTMPMNTPRNCHTATSLGDGTALMIGGIDPGSYIVSDVEQYDPATSAWSYVPSLNLTRMNHRATRLADGTVLVTGGRTDTYFNGGGSASSSGTTGLAKPSLALLGFASSPCYGSGGGGSGSGGPGANTTPTTELYDPTLPAFGWQMMSQMSDWRERHTATLLPSGQVLVVGGSDSGYVLDSSEVYDPFDDNWNYVYNWLWDARENHTATLLNDGTVLVTGGSDYFGNPLDTAEVFVPNTGGGSGSGGPGSWFVTDTMTTPRTLHSATLLPDGTVLVAGGNDGLSSLTSAEVYDPVTQSWTAVPSMMTARAEHAATSLSNGYVLVSGGLDSTDNPTSGAELYVWAYPLASPCSADNECQSGHCADGVCCDVDCYAGECTACTAALKGGGNDGVCGPALAGSNPHFDCFDDGVDTCGQTGICDGVGACELYPAGSTCDPAYCQGNFANHADLCDGMGTCVPQGSTLCDPGLCSNGTCDLTCVADSDCSTTGAYCNTGTCAPQKPVGQPAAQPNECQTGFASDGVCCDSPCGGTCTACSASKKGTGVDGVCGPIKVGTDPDSECAAQGAASCGTNGACDGSGACGLHAAGTVCSAASCVGSTLVQPSLCDGGGTCVPGGAVSCDPAGCAGGACLSGCATDPDCVGTAYCTGGNCAPQKPIGQPAAQPNECLSGHVADGVCCNTSCTGTCSACTALLKGGGIDGVCGPSLSGTDPDNECAAQAASTCGTTGTCDGNGACARHASGTACASASCSGNTLVQPSLCDGNGTCVSQGSTSCSPGTCAGGTCQAGCATDPDCVATAFCGAGKCQPKKPTGQSATTPNQCLSGHVADGICCDVACVGTCIACTASKKGSGVDGVCGAVQAGADPDLECADQGASSCGPTGSCNGAGTCALYPAGTVCTAGSCTGSLLTPPSLCDGAGTCLVAKGKDCAPAVCAGGTCQAVCVADSDCVTTAYCNTGKCTPKKPLGQPATLPNECLTGFLADGICCNTACTGTCVACTNKQKGSGSDGTCGPVQPGFDPDNECVDQGGASCGTNGVCSGQGSCALYGNGTVCNPGSCQGSVLTQPDLCDGNGVCVTSGTVDCSPANCAGNACDTSCLLDVDCTPTTYCDSGTCVTKKAPGEAALGGNECLTGFEADGVCCTSACAAGPCDACSLAAGGIKDGDCTPLTGAVCDDGDACTLVDECNAGVCQGSNPVVCSPMDECHDAGVCDPLTGACSPVPKPNGSACDDGNPCTTDACQTGTCTGVSKLDGTPCDGGVCIAGGCVLDPNVTPTTSSSSGGGSGSTTSGGTINTSTTTNATNGSGGEGGNGDFEESRLPNLVGGGCLSISPVEERSTGAGAGALFFALLAALRRRRDPRKPAGTSRRGA